MRKFVGTYVIIGLILGIILKSAIPAINLYGVGYYAFTWPLWVYASVTNHEVLPIPAWCFSFPKEQS